MPLLTTADGLRCRLSCPSPPDLHIHFSIFFEHSGINETVWNEEKVRLSPRGRAAVRTPKTSGVVCSICAEFMMQATVGAADHPDLGVHRHFRLHPSSVREPRRPFTFEVSNGSHLAPSGSGLENLGTCRPFGLRIEGTARICSRKAMVRSSMASCDWSWP